ncbi:MAG: hypothetical protein HQL31_06780 [Planctomycetes bacterium]|nr:hypothetical protein [Planctomycetota bacterium]
MTVGTNMSLAFDSLDRDLFGELEDGKQAVQFFLTDHSSDPSWGESWVYKVFGDAPSDVIKWATWQVEKCPTTGKLHYQAACCFKNRQRRGPLASSYFKGMWFVRCRGNAEQNIAYCNKIRSRESLSYWRFPSNPTDFKEAIKTSKGKRTDLIDLCEAVKQRVTTRELCSVMPTAVFKYQKYISEYRYAIAEAVPHTSNRCVIQCMGASGSGKSWWVHDQLWKLCGESNNVLERMVYEAPAANWFDGYEGQPIIVLDEYSADYYSYTNLLRYTDKYIKRIPRKGGFLLRGWRVVIITSCRDIHDWYPAHFYGVKLDTPEYEAKAYEWKRRVDHRLVFPHPLAPMTYDMKELLEAKIPGFFDDPLWNADVHPWVKNQRINLGLDMPVEEKNGYFDLGELRDAAVAVAAVGGDDNVASAVGSPVIDLPSDSFDSFGPFDMDPVHDAHMNRISRDYDVFGLDDDDVEFGNELMDDVEDDDVDRMWSRFVDDSAGVSR